MKKTLYVFALVLALGAAAIGIFGSSPSNVMAKGDDNGIRVGL